MTKGDLMHGILQILMSDKFQRIWGKGLLRIINYYRGSFLEWPRKTIREVNLVGSLSKLKTGTSQIRAKISICLASYCVETVLELITVNKSRSFKSFASVSVECKQSHVVPEMIVIRP